MPVGHPHHTAAPPEFPVGPSPGCLSGPVRTGTGDCEIWEADVCREVRRNPWGSVPPSTLSTSVVVSARAVMFNLVPGQQGRPHLGAVREATPGLLLRSSGVDLEPRVLPSRSFRGRLSQGGECDRAHLVA